MNNWAAEAWRVVVESAPEGIVICDATSADCPAVFVNPAFAQMCGYPAAALLGSNLRILQGTDRDQEARVRLAEAVSRGEPARVLVRNYRPDGSMFWNETVIQPVRAGDKVTHFIGYHRDASDRLKNAERLPSGLPSWLREDRLTGLHSRAYFEELLQRDWQLAQRDSHEIGLTLFDIDDLGAYNEKFDRSAGDAADAGIAGRAVELLVVGAEVVDIEQRQPDLVRVALRELPVPLQQLLEVGARMESGEAVLPQP